MRSGQSGATAEAGPAFAFGPGALLRYVPGPTPGRPRADPGPTPGRPRAHSRTLRQNRVTTTTTAPITRDELHRKLTSGEPVALFEVLPIGYWRKHHLPTAKSLPPDRVRELVPQLVPDRSAEIVLYCWDFT